MKLSTQTDNNLLSPKSTKRRSDAIFQDGRRRHLQKRLIGVSQPFILRLQKLSEEQAIERADSLAELSVSAVEDVVGTGQMIEL